MFIPTKALRDFIEISFHNKKIYILFSKFYFAVLYAFHVFQEKVLSNSTIGLV